MKLKDTFITQESDGEQIMVSVGGSCFVRSNATAAFIVDCLKEETTKEAIVNAMCDRYDAAREVIEVSVEKILCTLRSVDAIDE